MGGSIVEDRGRTGVRHAGSSCPTGGCGELPRLPWPAAHSGAFAPAGARKWVGIAAEIIPKASSNAGQSLSQPAAASSLYTREPLGRGCGLPRRPCGPPRNDNGFLSFRGGPTGRRGNPSFLRWTGVRAAEVVGPYGRSTEVPATGRCGHRPLRKAQSTTQASRRAAKRPRGMGENRRKDHPKRGSAPATAWAALSEAESAGIVAGQIRVLPDILRVQHGAGGAEVRGRPRPCSGRGRRVSGQNGLGPHPAAR